MRKFYLTTPLYYVNDAPHIGHAYSNIAADVLARYKRLQGYDVLFLTGTDEHGQKIQKAAEELNISPQELADRMHYKFIELWQKLDISYTDFIRTTEKRHIETVHFVFKKLYKKKDIYRGEYKGYYCIPCESFYPKTQLLDETKCPSCHRNTQFLKEKTLFFRLSNYKSVLKEVLKENITLIMPSSRRNEALKMLATEDLKDLSISRTTFSWGIPIPPKTIETTEEIENEVLYVWFDALINYLTGAGYYKDEEKFKYYWPPDIHIIGKDILRFHSIIWLGILLALDVKLPRRIFAHGWWTVEGKKMSKSLGNVINPYEIIDKAGVDGLRYFLLSEVPFGEDGDFSWDNLRLRLNSNLANNLGNLLRRTINLIKRYYNLMIPHPHQPLPQNLINYANILPIEVEKALEQLKFYDALKAIFKLVDMCNEYLDTTAPWSKDKDSPEAATTLYCTLEALRFVGVLLLPFVPTIATKILDQLNVEDNLRTLQALSWGLLKPTNKVKLAPPLFPRIE